MAHRFSRTLTSKTKRQLILHSILNQRSKSQWVLSFHVLQTYVSYYKCQTDSIDFSRHWRRLDGDRKWNWQCPPRYYQWRRHLL